MIYASEIVSMAQPSTFNIVLWTDTGVIGGSSRSKRNSQAGESGKVFTLAHQFHYWPRVYRPSFAFSAFLQEQFR
jgi:hypothetical protein